MGWDGMRWDGMGWDGRGGEREVIHFFKTTQQSYILLFLVECPAALHQRQQVRAEGVEGEARDVPEAPLDPRDERGADLFLYPIPSCFVPSVHQIKKRNRGRGRGEGEIRGERERRREEMTDKDTLGFLSSHKHQCTRRRAQQRTPKCPRQTTICEYHSCHLRQGEKRRYDI